MTTAVRFRFDGNSYTYVVIFAYDATLVALVKTVPAWARSWDRTTRQWQIHPDYADELADAMRQCGCEVIGIDDAPSRADLSWAQALFRRVGAIRADAVFRALTKVLHPDNPVTGNPQLQRELNAARAELREDTTA
jgi:hypothetical protein